MHCCWHMLSICQAAPQGAVVASTGLGMLQCPPPQMSLDDVCFWCCDPRQTACGCRLQVGMQNSALGAYLALAHFSDPLTAVPCAISACTHSLMGSAIAGFWRWRDLAGVQEQEVLSMP